MKELEAYERSVIEEINRSNERMKHLVMLHDEANLDDNKNNSKMTGIYPSYLTLFIIFIYSFTYIYYSCI